MHHGAPFPGLDYGATLRARGLRPLRGLRTPVNHGHEPPALRWMADKAFFLGGGKAVWGEREGGRYGVGIGKIKQKHR